MDRGIEDRCFSRGEEGNGEKGGGGGGGAAEQGGQLVMGGGVAVRRGRVVCAAEAVNKLHD